MPHCAAIGCNFQSKGNKGSGISLHCFPHDGKLREVWESACGREHLPKDPRLCSQHFTEDDFEDLHRVRLHKELTGTYFKRRIKPGAVPTIFPHKDPLSRKREKARNTSHDADLGSELYHGSHLDLGSDLHCGSDLDRSTDTDEPQDTDSDTSEEETDTDDQPDTTPDLEMDTMPVDRMRMRPWLEEQIDSSQIPGLKWVNKEERIFQIPWLHGAHQNWDLEKDAPLFMRWAIHTGKHRPGVDRPNPRMWKSNFRCALNSLPDIVEVKDKHIRRGSNAFRVYKMLSSKGSMSKGEPAHEMEESNLDRVPSLHLVQAEVPATKSDQDARRIQRSAETTTSAINTQGNGGQVPASGDKVRAVHQHQRVDEACTERAKAVMETSEEHEESETADEPVAKRQRGACEFCEQSRREIKRLLQENRELKSELNKRALKEEFLKDDVEKVKYYTGLSCFAILFSVFTNVEASLPATKKLSRFQMLLLTLMRLRLDLPVQHLCHLFNVSHKTLSSAFADTVDVLHARLGPLAFWPERHCLRATMPQQFSDTFGQRVAIVIDVFEIRIERRSNLKAHSKGTHTVKYLIGITPQGSISFISSGWGGRLSDKCITEKCGLLNKLLPGDVVLADRGFDLQDGERTMCAEVKMPSFTKGLCQLDATDVEDTRAVAHLRKRVERVIGTLRKKYKMLHATLPVRFVIPCEGEEGSLLDKMVNVCCILVNMCPSVKPENNEPCTSNET